MILYIYIYIKPTEDVKYGKILYGKVEQLVNRLSL